MKVCSKCGAQMPDENNTCTNCGNSDLVLAQNQSSPVTEKKGNIGWAILGFLIPLVGWILYFTWKDKKPGDAKMAGIGGIVGFIVNLLIMFSNYI